MDTRESSKTPRAAQIRVCVNDPDGVAIQNATILVYRETRRAEDEQQAGSKSRKKTTGAWQHPEGVVPAYYGFTGSDGCVNFSDVVPGDYVVECANIPGPDNYDEISAESGCVKDVCFTLSPQLEFAAKTVADGCTETD